MQLPRIIIAAVFFVIGLLIAVPALLRTTSADSNASQTPSPSTSASPVGGTSDPSPSARPSGSRSPSRSPSPTRTSAPSRPALPALPLTVSIGRVSCPDRTIRVTIRNRTRIVHDFTLETDGSTAPKGDRIAAGQSRTVELTLREDRRTRVTVTWRNEPVVTVTRTANCRSRSPVAGDPSPDDRLPHTGADSDVLWARAATGLAAMVTGVIIVWYGGVWPRRREQVFAKRTGD
ncbi:hypothetical protein [Thermomonospora umbrina]|uniref:Uncharacterized protein n=1 Tax=Thermomonospora umbrina TaxID=111806 RepID=A0A3D9SRN1_9ACTN|nr:hypothetical protein [Thermomonospora umbrina]REE98626.1 hypothetical protein DFJ69_4118 [Thermomonospora umbrina]